MQGVCPVSCSSVVERPRNQKVLGSTPDRSTRIFLFPSVPVSLSWAKYLPLFHKCQVVRYVRWQSIFSYPTSASGTIVDQELFFLHLTDFALQEQLKDICYLANTAPLFSQLKVLDIFSINSFSVATFMYSYHHNLLPGSFRDLFLSSNQVHHCEIRLASV